MPTLTLRHPADFPIGRYSDALIGESISPIPIESLEHLTVDGGSLRVVLVDARMANNGSSAAVLDPRTAIVGIGLSEQPRWLSADSVYLHVPHNPSPAQLLRAVSRAYQFLYQKMRADQLQQQLSDRTRELREVNEVGIALSTERDHSVLITKILGKAREVSRADAGSLYLLDEVNGEKVLRWKLAQNDSIDVESFEEKILPITRKSLAGFVALTGETLVIDDAYNLPETAEYTINRSFDEKNAYLTKSLLVFPMTNHAGEVIGVLQLINRKRAGAPARLTAASVPMEAVPFDEETVALMRALAGQAAVAAESNPLYESIQRLLEGFAEFSTRMDEEAAEQIAPLHKDFSFVAQSNEPTVLPEGEFNYLQQLAGREFVDMRGQKRLLLNPEEAKILSIRKGNLDAVERHEIESHVTHTFHFLQKIPWTKDLVGVPNIAYAHHEKLNGRGYPRKLTAAEIPIQSRMMTISDIYDALTANDRPYKRAISTERALDILKMEVGDGLLDPSLVAVFVEARVFHQAGVLRT